MEKFYNLSNDAVFKLFFTVPKNLALFINMLNKNYHFISKEVMEEDIEYLYPEDLEVLLKNIEMDIKFRIKQNNSFFNIEMQKIKTKYDIGERMAKYHSSLEKNSLVKGNIYGDAINISIWIFDYDDERLTKNKLWMEEYYLTGKNDNVIIAKNFISIFAFFLNHLDKAGIIELEEFFSLFKINKQNQMEFKTEIAKEAYTMLMEINEDTKKKILAQAIEDKELNERSEKYYIKQEGIELGIKQEKIQMVKSLYQNGVSLELISKSSGLSIDEIKEIIAE